MMRIRLVFAVVAVAVTSYAQKNTITIDRIEPPFWWTEMANDHLQLLVKGNDLSATSVTVDYPGVEVTGVTPGAHPGFLFVDLKISPQAKAGSVPITFANGKRTRKHSYELKERSSPAHKRGLDGGDVIYLITPDRFVNGDPGNDVVKGMKEGINRSFPGGRHGGDLAGILSKLDYIQDLGATTLWLNPIQENNMPEYSYHGYAITDFYKVDPRYGTNDQYIALSSELHRRGMKLVMDVVFNHCGLEHWWMKDMPFPDWVHDYPNYEVTNYSIASLSDPHAAERDRRQMEKGWFVPTMPDLNQDNPFMATYLIQNTIWWIEYAQLDGLRVDTYPYNSKEFMSQWSLAVLREFPDLYVVGETWIGSPAQVAWWTDRGADYKGYNSHTKAMADYPLYFATLNAFRKGGNVFALYEALSHDFLYLDPEVHKVFADNHDVDRIYHSVGGDMTRFRQVMSFLLTTRGIPQIYYGTEILMKGSGDHGVIREDFPGGWPGDTRNAFIEDGRTKEEQEAYEFLRRMLNWRKTSDAMARGTLKHFIPQDNVYVYNRKSDNQSILVMINNSDAVAKPDMARFAEVLTGYGSAKDVLSGKKYNDLTSIKIDPHSTLVLELKPGDGSPE
jgi:glycosidase